MLLFMSQQSNRYIFPLIMYFLILASFDSIFWQLFLDYHLIRFAKTCLDLSRNMYTEEVLDLRINFLHTIHLKAVAQKTESSKKATIKEQQCRTRIDFVLLHDILRFRVSSSLLAVKQSNQVGSLEFFGLVYNSFTSFFLGLGSTRY